MDRTNQDEEKVSQQYLRITSPRKKHLRQNFTYKKRSLSILWILLEEGQTRKKPKLTIQTIFHPRDDVDRLYVRRKEGERRYSSIDECADAYIQRPEEDIVWLKETYYSNEKLQWNKYKQKTEIKNRVNKNGDASPKKSSNIGNSENKLRNYV